MLSTGQAAKYLGVTVRTIYRWEAAGRLHPVRLPTGQRRFSRLEVDSLLRSRRNLAVRCAVYARVSSEKQVEAGNLERQLARLQEIAAQQGYEVVAVVRERASGLNEKRKGLRRLFRLAANGEIDLVLVEFQDRLARFGFAYVVEALGAYGVRVEVVDGSVAVDAPQELVQDMLAIVTCFAARLYGARSKQFRKKVAEAAREVERLG